MHMFLEESQNGVHTQADIVWWGTCSGAVMTSHAVEHRLRCTATERLPTFQRRAMRAARAAGRTSMRDEAMPPPHC